MGSKRLCPKCKTGYMYATGGGCNYRCELCGHTYYEAPPRVHISSGPSEKMSQATSELEDNLARTRQLRAEWEQERRAEKLQRKYEKAARKSQKEPKRISFGTLIGVFFILWLLAKLVS